MATGTAAEQIIMAKLGELSASIAELKAIVSELKATQGTNTTQIIAQVSDNIKGSVSAAVANTKTKKATAETKEGEVKAAKPVKPKHPTLVEVSDASWKLNEKEATQYGKRVKWFAMVMNKHPDFMTNLLGNELITEIKGSVVWQTNMANKKNDASSQATAFFKSLKEYLEFSKMYDKWNEVSTKLIAAYDAEKKIYDDSALPQAKPETATLAESSAANALAALTGTPVTVHTGIANQLAAV